MRLATPAQNNGDGTVHAVDSSSLKADKGTLLDIRARKQSIADVNDASIADGTGCKVLSLKKKKKKKRKKKKKGKNTSRNDSNIGTAKVALRVVNQSLDKASDRLVVLNLKHLDIQNLLEKHKKAADEMQHLDTLKANSQRGILMMRRKRKELLRRITEALQGVDDILKEYPELSRKKHFNDLQDAVKEDIFADDDKATNFNEHFSRIREEESE